MILVSGIGLHVIIIVNDWKLGMKKRKDDEAVTALGRLRDGRGNVGSARQISATDKEREAEKNLSLYI